MQGEILAQASKKTQLPGTGQLVVPGFWGFCQDERSGSKYIELLRSHSKINSHSGLQSGIIFARISITKAEVIAGYVNGFVIDIRAKMTLSWNLRM